MDGHGAIPGDPEYLEALASTLTAEAEKLFPGERRTFLLGGASALRTGATMLRARHRWRNAEPTPTVHFEMPPQARSTDDTTDVD